MKVVINRTDAIGDTLLTLPMAYELKRRYPKARIVMLVTQRVAPILEHSPVIDESWTWATHYSTLTNALRLWRYFRVERPDSFFHVGGSLWPLMLAWLCRIPMRGGILSKWPTFFFMNHGERQSRSMVVMHEAQYNINLLLPLEIRYEESMINEWHGNLIRLSPEEKKTFEEKREALFLKLGWDKNKPYLIIHPGMTGHTLNWPLTHYARLIRVILRSYQNNLGILVSGTPADKNVTSTLMTYLGDLSESQNSNLHFFNGAVEGLRHYMYMLERAHLFIGPSTGPAHLANILETKGIYIYSPIKSQSAKRWGPLFRQKISTLMIPDVICGEDANCAGHVCPYYECMPQIEVEQIFAQIEVLLKKENIIALTPLQKDGEGESESAIQEEHM